MEYNAWGACASGPDHEPTLVYTRMLSGPMDFTPGVLSLEGANKAPLASTLAKQLGLYLAIYSPIQMAADFIENLEAHPRELRSEEHTSELQSLMRISYAVFCLKKQITYTVLITTQHTL